LRIRITDNWHIEDNLTLLREMGIAKVGQALRDEFDQLYEEGGHRRRMMVVSLHDRISGHANRVRSLDRFLTYARSKPDVWFARKDEIARWALSNRSDTTILKRGPPTVTGLPGSAA
jgi:hypothetical protein